MSTDRADCNESGSRYVLSRSTFTSTVLCGQYNGKPPKQIPIYKTMKRQWIRISFIVPLRNKILTTLKQLNKDQRLVWAALPPPQPQFQRFLLSYSLQPTSLSCSSFNLLLHSLHNTFTVSSPSLPAKDETPPLQKKKKRKNHIFSNAPTNYIMTFIRARSYEELPRFRSLVLIFWVAHSPSRLES